MKRDEAKALRRERILDQARILMSDESSDSFSLRNLAAAADVNVGTIYNLIGGKNKILLELWGKFINEQRNWGVDPSHDHVIEFLEERIRARYKRCTEEEQFIRATYIAFDTLRREGEETDTLTQIEQIMIRNFADIAARAQARGELRGSVPSEVIGRLIYASERTVATDWAYRNISLDEAFERSLLTVHILLLADASPRLRPELEARINRTTTVRRSDKSFRQSFDHLSS